MTPSLLRMPLVPTWALPGALILSLGLSAGCTPKEEVDSGEEEESDADTDADTDSDTDSDADTDADTDTDTDTDTDADVDFVVDGAEFTWQFAVQDGAITNLPGLPAQMRVHLFDSADWRSDYENTRKQCMVKINIASAGLIDWSSTYPGLFGAWDLGVVGSAVSGTEHRCSNTDFTAIGGDPTAFVEALSVSFGLVELDESHSTLFSTEVDGWEAVASAAAYGVLHYDLGSGVETTDQYVVIGYELDGDNLASSGGSPVLLDLTGTWYLPDGFYEAYPVNYIVSLGE